MLCILLLTGCATTQPLNSDRAADLDLLNQRVADRPVTILLLDETRRYGRDLEVRPDSTFWTEQGTNQARAIPTSEIYAIEAAVFKESVFSSKAFGIGLAAGAGSMLMMNALSEDPTGFGGGQTLLAVGISVVSGVLASVLLRQPEEEDEAVGRFVLHKTH